MKRLLALSAIVSIVVSVAANAQTRPGPPMAPRFIDPVNGLTLDQAIAQALDQEPGLRAVRSEVEMARGFRAQAAARPNPTVSFAQQTEPAGTDAQTRVDVQWPLDLFRRTGRINVADLEIEAAERAASDRERQLAADVRTKFGAVLAAVQAVAIADELLALTERQETLTTARADVGAIPPLERDMLRVERQRLEAERVLKTGHAEHALIELKRILGRDANAPLMLREDLGQLVEREIAVSLPSSEASVAGRADVEEAQTRVRLSESRIDQARRAGRMDMTAFGTYMRTDAGFPQRGLGAGNDLERVRGVFHYLAGGVMVSVPLLDRKQGDVAAAQAQLVGAQSLLAAARLTAQAEVAAARARDEHARRALALYGAETRALAKRNLDVVGQAYELGRMTLFEVLTEQRRYLDTEQAYAATLREAYDARQALRLALGEVR